VLGFLAIVIVRQASLYRSDGVVLNGRISTQDSASSFL